MYYLAKSQRQGANPSYIQMQNIEFHNILFANQYNYPHSILLRFPIVIKENMNNSADIKEIRTIRNVFAYQIKEIENKD